MRLCKKKLKEEQTMDPVETLFVIREKNTNRYKYCGDGELLDRFVSCKPLAESFPTRKNRYSSLVVQASAEKPVEPLTPHRYKYACVVTRVLYQGRREPTRKCPFDNNRGQHRS